MTFSNVSFLLTLWYMSINDVRVYGVQYDDVTSTWCWCGCSYVRVNAFCISTANRKIAYQAAWFLLVLSCLVSSRCTSGQVRLSSSIFIDQSSVQFWSMYSAIASSAFLDNAVVTFAFATAELGCQFSQPAMYVCAACATNEWRRGSTTTCYSMHDQYPMLDR